MKNGRLPNERKSFWYETGYKNDYPQLVEDQTTDVAVVGGGIAGILTAYTLAKEGYKVTLLEGQKLLSGTTGYTTAKLSAQHQLIYDELLARYDKDVAKLYYQANMNGIQYMRNIVEENNLKSQIETQSSFVYTQDKHKTNQFDKEMKAYTKLDIDGALRDDIPLNMKVEKAIEMKEQAQFHPVSFLHEVLDITKELNAEVYEHSLVVDVQRTENKDKLILVLKNGKQVTCSNAVFATHFPSFDPENSYPKMNAQMSYGLALKATKDHSEGMYINDDFPKRTFRKTNINNTDYLLVGGQSHPIGDHYQEAERYEELYNAAKELFGETDVVYRWSAHDLMTKDRIPFIGELHPDYPNIYTLTGFSKWGLAHAANGALLITDIIANRENTYRNLYDPQREIPDMKKYEDNNESTMEEISTLDLPILPEHVATNEATIIKRGKESIGVYKDNSGKIHYLNISCTHLGCTLNWNNGDNTWDCPCHGSRFTATGEVFEGPAMQNLTKK